MGFLKAFAASPAAILLCLLAGGFVGWSVPSASAPLLVLGKIYLSLVNLVAIPLMVVATFFGLRQVLALPSPAWRSFFIVALAIGLVAAGALAGTAYGVVTGPGQSITPGERAYLGSVVQGADGQAGNVELNLYGPADVPASTLQNLWSTYLPDNFFRALAMGQSLGIFTCAILFGLAFASMPKAANGALMGIFDAIYRTFEVIISRVNLFIPLLAFGIAADFAARAEPQTLHAMSSFLTSFIGLALLLSLLAITLVWKSSGGTLSHVVRSLKTPALISLTSASSTASIPDTIRAMSATMGYSRGIVELVVPAASIFVRTGSAVYFALLAVFVANIYGLDLVTSDLVVICLGATVAAFVSSGSNSIVTVGSGSIVLSMLNLPVEAALALFLAIDLICEGPRNLLSMLCSCVLIVLVCRGLPSERVATAPEDEAGPRPVQLVFTKLSALAALVIFVILAALVTIAGIGVGQRMGLIDPPLGNTPVLSRGAVVDNSAYT